VTGSRVEIVRARRAGLLLLAALGIGALLPSQAVAQAGPPSVKQVVQKHLDWIATTRNYRAALTVDDGNTIYEATVLVDYMTHKTIILSTQPGLPPGMFVKTTSLPDGTLRVAVSRGLARSDDLPVQEKTLPPGPFSSGSYSAFVRGAALDETMERLNAIADELSVRPATELGAYGLEIVLRREFMSEVASAMDRFFEVEGETYPHTVVQWLAEDGSTSAIEETDDSGRVLRTSLLEYEEVNIAAAQIAPIILAATAAPPPTVQPPLRPPPGQAPLPFEEAADAVLNSWAVFILSMVMLAFCVLLVVRLRNSTED